MIREIIYDFDGTLSDSYPLFARAFLEQLRRHGIEESYEKVYSLLKVSLRNALSRYPLGEHPNRELHSIHIPMALEEQMPIEGAAEVLSYAVENGGRNYIFTHSGTEVKKLLEKWGFMPYITDIIDSSYAISRKPSPEGIAILMKNNGIDPKEAIIVGDRDIDLMSGKNAGIKSCLFDPEHYYDNAEYDFRIDRLVELKKYILI